MQICYVDESGGTENPDSSRTATPALILVGVIVDSSQLEQLTRDFLRIKRNYFPARYEGVRALDDILVEVKGSEVMNLTRSASRDNRRLAYRLRCELIALLAMYGCRLIGRVWIKEAQRIMSSVATYCYSVQDISKHFSAHLRDQQTNGILVADGRTHSANLQVAHAIFTQKWRTAGNAYPAVEEIPLFAASDNHAGLQIADLVASALVMPMAVAAYCPRRPNNVHSSPRYAEVRDQFGTALRDLQYRYQDTTGRWRVGSW